MKYFTILSVLVLAVLLASCTQTGSDISPVGPNLSKTNSATLNQEGPVYPFPLFTSFKSYANNGWISAGKFNQVIVRLINPLPKTVAFAIVEYSNAPGPITTNGNKEMVYLDIQDGTNITVPVTPGSKIQNITIYGLTNSIYVVGNLYSEFQEFNYLKVDEWKSSERSIVITSSAYNKVYQQVFAEFSYGNNSTLIFLQKPASQLMSVPNSNGSKVTSVSLFGLSASVGKSF